MSHVPPVYLDHAATTPMHPAAIEAMTAALSTVGNASSLHTAGRAARRRMEESRESIAARLGARPSEVVFTAGGTESDNLAVKGIYWARRDTEPRRRRIITTAVEHHAVLDSVGWLVEHEGAEVSYLPTEPDGSVTIVDWKSGAPSVGQKAHAAAVQLATYRIAYARLTGRDPDTVRAAFYYAATGETVYPPLRSASELTALVATLRG